MLIVLLPEISAPLTCSLSSQASDRYLSWGQRCLWAAKQTGFCSQTPGASLRQAKGKKLWTCLLFYAAQYRPLDAIHNRGLLWRKGGGDVCTQDIWRLEVCWSQTCYSTEEHAAGRAWWLRLAVVLIVRCELNSMAVAAWSFLIIRELGAWCPWGVFVVPITVQMTSGSSQSFLLTSSLALEQLGTSFGALHPQSHRKWSLNISKKK